MIGAGSSTGTLQLSAVSLFSHTPLQIPSVLYPCMWQEAGATGSAASPTSPPTLDASLFQDMGCTSSDLASGAGQRSSSSLSPEAFRRVCEFLAIPAPENKWEALFHASTEVDRGGKQPMPGHGMCSFAQFLQFADTFLDDAQLQVRLG